MAKFMQAAVDSSTKKNSINENTNIDSLRAAMANNAAKNWRTQNRTQGSLTTNQSPMLTGTKQTQNQTGTAALKEAMLNGHSIGSAVNGAANGKSYEMTGTDALKAALTNGHTVGSAINRESVTNSTASQNNMPNYNLTTASANIPTGSSSSANSGGGGSTTDALYSAYIENINQQMRAQQQAAQESLSNALQQYQAQLRAQLEAQQQAQQQAAQNAYDNNMASLENAYAKQISGLGDNLGIAKDQLGREYQDSVNVLNQNTQNALQQAYISKMLSQRDLKNQLNQQGISGGAAESTIASMLNNYGNNRNAINTTAADNLASLQTNYNDNLATAQQKYNDAMANAEANKLSYSTQFANDLAAKIVGSYGDLQSGINSMNNTYANALTNLITSQASNAENLNADAYSQMAANALKNMSAKVSTSGGSSTAAAKGGSGLSRAQQLLKSGMNMDDAVNQMYLEGYTPEQLYQIFAEI